MSLSTGSSGVRLVAFRSLKQPLIIKSIKRQSHRREVRYESNLPSTTPILTRPDSIPSLASGTSTFLNFELITPTNSEIDINIDVNVTSFTNSIINRRMSTPATVHSSSPFETPIRRTRSYSSVPTIDRTISEDSLLVIKRL